MQEVEARFAGEPKDVSAARRFVSQALEAAGQLDQAWIAAQIVSELATNAVLHAGTGFVVRVGAVGGLVRLAVVDERPGSRAAKRQFSAETTTGRGLRLVEELSRAWGVVSDGATKTVWCEIVEASVDGDAPDSADDSLPMSAEGAVPAPLADSTSGVPAPTARRSMSHRRRAA